MINLSFLIKKIYEKKKKYNISKINIINIVKYLIKFIGFKLKKNKKIKIVNLGYLKSYKKKIKNNLKFKKNKNIYKNIIYYKCSKKLINKLNNILIK